MHHHLSCLQFGTDRRGQINENDVRSLREFRRILDATFVSDLAWRAKLTASNVRGGASEEEAVKLLEPIRATAPASLAPRALLLLGRAVTGDQETKREGERQEDKGKLKGKLDSVVEKAEHALEDVKHKVDRR